MGSYVTVIGSHRCSSSFVWVVTDSSGMKAAAVLAFLSSREALSMTARWSAGRSASIASIDEMTSVNA